MTRFLSGHRDDKKPEPTVKIPTLGGTPTCEGCGEPIYGRIYHDRARGKTRGECCKPDLKAPAPTPPPSAATAPLVDECPPT